MTTTSTVAEADIPRGSSVQTTTILFDTNVWIDYFLGREGVVDDIVDLIADVRSSGYSIATTVSIKKDVFYIIPRELHRRASGERPTASTPTHGAFTEIAWALLDQMDDLATVVPIGMREDFFARHLRSEHGDYEDDALVATARSIGARCVATSDIRLLSRFPDVCRTPADARGLFMGPLA